MDMTKLMTMNIYVYIHERDIQHRLIIFIK